MRVKLKKLDEWNARRRELAEIYFERLKDFPAIQLPDVRHRSEAVFHLFVIRHRLRDRLKDFLAEKGIGSAIHYPYLLHEQKNFRSAEQESLPVAEKIYTEILSLPLSPQMENSQIETVCDAIEEFENENSTTFSRRANPT